MRKLLLVEDDPVIRTYTVSDLQEAGYDVQGCMDLKTARQLNQETDFDLILLDLNLPDGTGYEWATELRKQPNSPPIIFLTSLTDIESIRKGFELGASDYVKKPFDSNELILRIKRSLNDFHTGSGEERRIGNYTYNPATHELRHREESVILSHLQHSVLNELSAVPGQVVNKEQLLARYWGESNYFTSRNLDSVIVKLRARFKADTRVYFLASKKEGYRLVIWG